MISLPHFHMTTSRVFNIGRFGEYIDTKSYSQLCLTDYLFTHLGAPERGKPLIWRQLYSPYLTPPFDIDHSVLYYFTASPTAAHFVLISTARSRGENPALGSQAVTFCVASAGDMTWELGHLLPPVDLPPGVVDAK
jgi:hypothetical protein